MKIIPKNDNDDVTTISFNSQVFSYKFSKILEVKFLSSIDSIHLVKNQSIFIYHLS